MFGRFALAVGCLVVGTAPAVCASLTDRPPPASLQKDVRCMVRTLKAMPQIDSVKSEVARYAGMPTALVEYRDRSKAGRDATIRFEARGLEPPFYFMTGLPGLFSAEAPLSDYGTDTVTHAWKAHCNVRSGAVHD